MGPRRAWPAGQTGTQAPVTATTPTATNVSPPAAKGHLDRSVNDAPDRPWFPTQPTADAGARRLPRTSAAGHGSLANYGLLLENPIGDYN